MPMYDTHRQLGVYGLIFALLVDVEGTVLQNIGKHDGRPCILTLCMTTCTSLIGMFQQPYTIRAICVCNSIVEW